MENAKKKVNKKQMYIGIISVVLLTIIAGAIICSVCHRQNTEEETETGIPVKEDIATQIDNNGNRMDYYYSEDDRGKGYIKDVFADNPSLLKAVKPDKEQNAALDELMSGMDKCIVQVEKRYVENGELVTKEEIQNMEDTDCGYAYSLDMKEDEFCDTLQNLADSGFEFLSVDYTDVDDAGFSVSATESQYFTSSEDYVNFAREHSDNYMSFMLVMENEEHEVVAVATFIHLAPSIPEQYYYTDSNWNTYSYTDWLIVNFNAGYEGN